MRLEFRKANSPGSRQQVIDFLIQDVKQYGGSATEVIDFWGQLQEITVSSSPWGMILIIDETTPFQVWVNLLKAEQN